MNSILTLDDLRPVPMPPPMRFTYRREIRKLADLQPGESEFSKRLPQGSPGLSEVPKSPVQPYAAENVPPEGMPYGSPAALTDKAIWERFAEFRKALSEAIKLSETMVFEDEASPIDDQTLSYAVSALTPLFISVEIPAPLILPLQNGGIGAEWHAFGMNIELRFRNPYHTYAVLEDARGVIPPFHGRDPGLVQTHTALREFATRVD
jgi:hypothetical protein